MVNTFRLSKMARFEPISTHISLIMLNTIDSLAIG